MRGAIRGALRLLPLLATALPVHAQLPDINPMTGLPDSVEALRVRLAQVQLQARIETELTSIERSRQERRRGGGGGSDEGAAGPLAPALANPLAMPPAQGVGERSRRGAAAASTDPARPAPAPAPAAPRSARAGHGVTPAALRAASGAVGDPLRSLPAQPLDARPAARLVGVLDDRAGPHDPGNPVALIEFGGRTYATHAGFSAPGLRVEQVGVDGASINGAWQHLPAPIGRIAAQRLAEDPLPRAAPLSLGLGMGMGPNAGSASLVLPAAAPAPGFAGGPTQGDAPLTGPAVMIQ
jgi:hypothetical protein